MNTTETTSPVARLGTIALVTMVRSSNSSTAPAGELIEEIRNAIQTSEISKRWSIEKITILGESEPLATGLSPAPTNETT
jgi:hypothetical protein